MVGEDALEEVFEAVEVLFEVEFVGDDAEALLAHGAGELFVLEEAIDAGGVGFAIHPGDEVAVDVIVEPIADAAGVEGDNGECVAHDFEADGGDGFRPDGADGDDGTFAVVVFEFFLGNEAFEGDAIGDAEFLGELFAVGSMAAFAEDDALELRFEEGEGFEEDIDAFAADDLAGVNDEVAIAEIAAEMRIAGAGDGRVNFDFVWVEAVLEEFGAHEIGDDDHAIEFLVEGNFAFFGGEADVFEGEAFAVIARDKCAAAVEAVGGGGAGADLSRAVEILVAAHAVDVVVVDHADEWDAGIDEGFEDA